MPHKAYDRERNGTCPNLLVDLRKVRQDAIKRWKSYPSMSPLKNAWVKLTPYFEILSTLRSFVSFGCSCRKIHKRLPELDKCICLFNVERVKCLRDFKGKDQEAKLKKLLDDSAPQCQHNFLLLLSSVFSPAMPA